MLIKKSESRAIVSDSLRPHGPYSPWSSPDQNTGMDSFPSPGNLSNPGVEPASLASPAQAGRFFTPEPPGKPLYLTPRPQILYYLF